MEDNYYAAAAVVIAAVMLTIFLLVLFIQKRTRKTKQCKTPYVKKDSLLSPAEKNFYDALRKIAGENIAICPKPSLREVMEVKETVKEDRWTYFNRISQKHVDFLLCDKYSMEIICAVELDDSSHLLPERQERDEFIDRAFASAELDIFHIPCRRRYGAAEVGELYSYLKEWEKEREAPRVPFRAGPPRCPQCGAKMVLRTAQKGEFKGQQFYGCSNFPKCRAVLPTEWEE